MAKITLKLLELYDKQLEVFRTLLNPKIKHVVINGGRQVGKSLLLIQYSIHYALNNKDKEIMVVSHSDGQAKFLERKTLEIIEPAHNHIVKSFKIQSGDAEIVFKNGSRIIYRSAKSENTLRGFSPNVLLADEVGFWKEEVWTTILQPMLQKKNAECKVIFCSTPKGNNFFRDLYTHESNGREGWKSFKITYLDNPFADKEAIEDTRRILPEEIFNQEYLGEFIDSSSVFKYVDELATILPDTPREYGQQYFQGWDIAFANDYCVGITLNSRGEVVDMVRFNKVSAPEMRRRIKESVKKWAPRRIIIEKNNQGLPVISDLKSEGVQNIQDFTTTEGSKILLINQLIAAFAKKEVKLLNDKVLIEECKAFTAKLTDTGKIKFEAGFGHDDCVMALAMAWECRSKFCYRQSFVLL